MKKDINDVLEEMKQIDKLSERYTELWEIVIFKYERMIYKLIGTRPNEEDLFQDCVEKLPDIIDAWNVDKAQFSTFLTWRLRGLIQNKLIHNKLIYYKHADRKNYYKKKKSKKDIFDLEIVYPFAQNVEIGKHVSSQESEIEQEIDFNKYMDMIKHIKHFDWWYDFHFNGKTLEEIGKMNKISREWVRVKVKRANETIKERLTKYLKE